MYNDDLRDKLRRRARVEGIPDCDADEVVDRCLDKLDRWCRRDPPSNEDDRWSRAKFVLRGVVFDYRRKRGRRGKHVSTTASEDDDDDVVLVDSEARTPDEIACDREELELLNQRFEQVLDSMNDCYLAGAGPCLNIYDRQLVRLRRQEPDGSLRRHGRVLKRYFARHHANGCCDIAGRHETFACRRWAEIADRMRGD